MPLTQKDLDSAVTVDRAAVLLSSEELASSGRTVAPYALIVLNQPISNLALLERIWSNGKLCYHYVIIIINYYTNISDV